MRRIVLVLGLVLLSMVVAAVIAIGFLRSRVSGPAAVNDSPDVTIDIPRGNLYGGGSFGRQLDISPNGKQIVYVGQAGKGSRALFVHTIGEKEPIEIPDTGAGNRDIRDPTFSPDGRYIAYWAQGVVKKTTPDGTMASEFGKAPSTRGIGWIDNDTLVLGNAQSAMLKLSAGTEPVPLVNTTGTTMPQVSPHVLPGNKAILFTMASGDLLNARIRVLILDTGEERQLLDTNAFAPRYLPSGHIVFARGATRELMAVRFDLSTLKVVGSPQLVLNVPLLGSGISGTDYAVSETGVLVYTPYREAGSDTLIGWFGDPTKIHVRLNWSVP